MFEYLDRQRSPRITKWVVRVIISIFVLFSYVFFSNLNLAIQRGKQKRNLADMRAIGTAIEAYGVDHREYPRSNAPIYAIAGYLEPLYLKKVPLKDKWGNHFRYRSDDGKSYTLTSYGKDHKPDPVPNYVGIITRFTNDIRFSNGSFIAFPEGI